MASKSHRSIMGPRDLGTRALCVYPGPLYCFFRGVRLSVGVKKWFEALTGKFLPFVVSYISHFICSYNPNYNFRPLRGPSIILIPLGFTPLASPRMGIATRQWRFEIRVFLLLDELPTKVDELHLAEATCFKAPVTHLSSLSPVSRNRFAGCRTNHT